jgi:hypothetical protein
MEEMEAQLGDRQPESTRRVQGRSEVFTHFVPGPQPVNTPNAPSPHSHEGNDSRDSRRRYTSRLNENVLKHDVRYVSTDELECTSVTQFTPGSNLRARSSRGRSARVMESMLQLISAMEASGDECMCVCTHARVGRCPRRRVHAHRTVLLCAYIHTQINPTYEYCLQKGPKKKNNNPHLVNAITAYMPIQRHTQTLYAYTHTHKLYIRIHTSREEAAIISSSGLLHAVGPIDAHTSLDIALPLPSVT